MALKIYLLNDNILQLEGLQNYATGDYLTSATVTVTLVDSDGVDVVGETWPLTMIYVSGTDATYRCTLSDSLSLTKWSRYRAQITADAGSGLRGYWEPDLIAHRRPS